MTFRRTQKKGVGPNRGKRTLIAILRVGECSVCYEVCSGSELHPVPVRRINGRLRGWYSSRFSSRATPSFKHICVSCRETPTSFFPNPAGRLCPYLFRKQLLFSELA